MLKFLYDGRLGEMFAPTKGAKDELERAIHAGDLSACADLVQAQKFDLVAHVNSQTGLNYLHTACQCGHREVAQLLLDAGSDVNAANARDGATALHYAATQGHTPVVEFLIERGASGSAKDAKGKTAYDLATKPSLRQFLLKFLYASQAQTEEQAAALLATPPAQAGTQFSAANAVDYGKCDGFGTSSHHDPSNPNYRGGQPWETVSGPPPTGTSVAQTSVYASAGTANITAQSKYVAYVNPFTGGAQGSGAAAAPAQLPQQAVFSPDGPAPYAQPQQYPQQSPFQHRQPVPSPFQQQPRTNPFQQPQQPVTNPFQRAHPQSNPFQQQPQQPQSPQQQFQQPQTQQQFQSQTQPQTQQQSQPQAQPAVPVQQQPASLQQAPSNLTGQQQSPQQPLQPAGAAATAAVTAPPQQQHVARSTSPGATLAAPAAPSDGNQSAAAALFS